MVVTGFVLGFPGNEVWILGSRGFTLESFYGISELKVVFASLWSAT